MLLWVFRVKHSVKIGTKIKLEITEIHKPEINTTPSGCQRLPPNNVNGIRPPIVVRLVNKIGVKRTALAFNIAERLFIPKFKLVLALSIKIIALFTTIPNKLIKPTKAIIENDKPVKYRPMIDPAIAKGIELNMIKGCKKDLNCNTKTAKIPIEVINIT